MGAALITSSLAVAVGSSVTHDQPNLDWPIPELSYLLTAYGLVGPVGPWRGLAFNRLMAPARRRATSSRGC